MRALLSGFFLILIALSGCSSGSESGPVSLPIPFSGSLTADTRVVNSNGVPTAQGLLLGHPSGRSWNLVDLSGIVGTFSLNLDSMTPPVIDRTNPNKRTFTITACFIFDESVSSVCADLEYIDFLIDSPISFDLAEAAPGEIGAKAVTTKGVASGLIKTGEGLFDGAAGNVIQYNYVYGWVEHSDGVRTFFQHQTGTTLIQGFGGLF